MIIPLCSFVKKGQPVNGAVERVASRIESWEKQEDVQPDLRREMKDWIRRLRGEY